MLNLQRSWGVQGLGVVYRATARKQSAIYMCVCVCVCLCVCGSARVSKHVSWCDWRFSILRRGSCEHPIYIVVDLSEHPIEQKSIYR